MGLLGALDYYYETGATESLEVEYRLISWGEIYPPFLGNREHDIAAQHILPEFPFKLFSSSRPYSGLPQKLCLTFKVPSRPTVRIIGGYDKGHPDSARSTSGTDFSSDDAAKEFAAFLSIVTRRRVFLVSQTRSDGLPIEEQVNRYERSHFQPRQMLKEILPPRIDKLLRNLLTMERRLARSFMLATRLYHSAVEMMYTESEFSYLFLVMTLEAIASSAYKDYRPSDEATAGTDLGHFLDSRFPGWRRICDLSTPQRREQAIEMLLTKEYFARRKFRRFVCDNVPEVFWQESRDDAKPGHPLVSIVPWDNNIHEYERIDKDNLTRVLGEIYDARSKFVHEGIPLPSYSYWGIPRIPWRVLDDALQLAASQQGAPVVTPPIPPLHTLERLVSYCMVEFLDKSSQTDYYVYQNWQAGPHKAVIHRGSCWCCNNGTGRSRGKYDPRHGKWSPPFPTCDSARAFAERLHGVKVIKACHFCKPEHG